MILDILWLLVLHGALTEMAIKHCCVPYSTFLFRESFCCVSVPLPSPFLPRGYFVWHLKGDYVVSGSQESLQNPEKWEVGGQCEHRGGVAGLEPPLSAPLGSSLTERALCAAGAWGPATWWLAFLSAKALPTVSRAGKKWLFSVMWRQG